MKRWRVLIDKFLLKHGYIKNDVTEEIKNHILKLKKSEGDLKTVFIEGEELLKVERIIKKWSREVN